MIRSNRSIRNFCSLVIAVFALATVAPASALAQDIAPPDEQYGNGVLGVAGGGSGNQDDPAAAAASGSDSSSSGISELPFTGLDVAAIAAIGVGLVGAGFMVRRAARTSDDGV